MSEEARKTAVLNLMRRMPTQNFSTSLAAVSIIAPDISYDILQDLDEPLRTARDSITGKQFILCDYNRDGDDYRSPHSNKYFDPETGEQSDSDFLPSPELRLIEQDANVIFDTYRDQYFQGGLSSVYFFDCEDGAFGAAWLIHKEVPAVETLKRGYWDSIHIFDVSPTKNPDEFQYTLTSTVIMSMNLEEAQTGNVDLSGTLSTQTTKVASLSKFVGHIQNMGKMLEQQESLLRNRIEVIYIQKTREVLSGARSSTGQRDQMWASITNELNEQTHN